MQGLWAEAESLLSPVGSQFMLMLAAWQPVWGGKKAELC